ncbi:MAG: FAD-binding oxidoreductase [Actinomycetota bacterium]
MDLIEPITKASVVAAVCDAASEGRRLLAVGGRTHLDRGEPSEIDAELSTTKLDRLVSYEPPEMIAVVEAGMRFGELSETLAAAGQEWAVDAPREATVGGVIASGMSSPRRLRVGHVRDTVLEVQLVTGDGRIVRGGGRTVKNVTGYDLPRLATGSLGTLGVIVQVALKLRPLPTMRRTVVLDGSVQDATRALAAIPLAAAVLASRERVEVLLEGWPEAVEEQTACARATGLVRETIDDAPFPSHAPWNDRPVVVEASVPAGKIENLARAAGDAYGALVGVGTVWAGLSSADGELSELRERAAALGGIAPVIRGTGGLGAPPGAMEIQRRLKRAFDPHGVLAPGRFWGGI